MSADSSLIQFDKQIAESTELIIFEYGSDSFNIAFQFPPKIVSESNSSLWDETPTRGIEPVKIHAGSSGRKLNVEWEYIATGGNIWNPTTVSNNLRGLKSYFYLFDWAKTYPVVTFRYLEVSPKTSPGPFYRMRDCNISYGPEIVTVNGKSHPLYTKVSISIELATFITPIQDGKFPKVVVLPLTSCQPEWL